MLEFSEQLFSLLVSPYSYLQITTYEEARIIQTISALATQLQRPVQQWNTDEPSVEGLLQALNTLQGSPAGTMLIFADAHPYLDDPRVVRKLRQLEPELSDSSKIGIFVSPFVTIPQELVKDFTILKAPLPGRVELTSVIDQVFASDELTEQGKARVVVAALGLTGREASRAFHRARFERKLSRKRGEANFDLEAAIVKEKRRLIEFDRVLEFVELTLNLEDVGGMDSLKGWLEERKDAFSTEAQDFGLPTPRGLLLTGVQGCGKSLFAKAVAGFWGIPLLRLDIGRLFDGGQPPEGALSRALEVAQALSPSILWCDEIEKGLSESGTGAVARMMATLLTWLEEKEAPVFFVATANAVDRLPPELLRKGRFDEVFFVDLPPEVDRQEILRIHIARQGRSAQNFDLPGLAERTQFFSGAELEQVVVAALYKAFAKRRDIEQIDLEAAIQETIPLYRTYEDAIKAQRQWASSRARSATRDTTLVDLFKFKRPVE